MITGKNFVGYNLSANSSVSVTATITINGENNQYNFHDASPEEIRQACILANKAFISYRNFSAEQKATFLEKVADAIAANKDQLVAIAMQETHLAKPRLEGEVGRTINQAKLFAALLREGSWVHAIIDTAQPDRKPLPKPDIRQMQIALGPVAVFGASNFPFAFSVFGGDTVSAFAAGCSVVCKAHPGHPATSAMVAQIIIDAAKQCNLPEGIFSMLYGTDNAISIALVTNYFIKAVGFTGSLNGGKALFDAASKRKEPIPVYAEMGSTNPVFVLPGILKTDATAVVEKLAASNLLSVGQFCTNPGIIVSLACEQTKTFSEAFAAQIQNAAAAPMLTENICSNYNNAVTKISGTTSVIVAAKGKPLSEKDATPVMLLVAASDFLQHNELWHEVFGPFSIHVVAANKEEMLAVAASLEGQLTASIWGNENDLLSNKELIAQLELKAGRVILNNVPTGVEVTYAMVHGGPFPATTDSRTTSVGTNAIYRFTRAVCYQNFAEELLPAALQNKNPLNIWRMVNGTYSNHAIE